MSDAMANVTQPPLARHDSRLLDLAFAMDTTGSMSSYIHSARDNIRRIVEDIVAKESSDVRLALVEYRDHPPQDRTYVTQVHDFTARVAEMKQWLEASRADGGGDAPEAVADALHDVSLAAFRPNGWLDRGGLGGMGGGGGGGGIWVRGRKGGGEGGDIILRGGRGGVLV